MNIYQTVEKLQRQQSALADFGSFAFVETDLEKILTQAAQICAASLEAPYAKICRYRVLEDDLLVVAGCVWHAGVVGYVVSAANESSTQGRAFVTGEPVILEDVSKNNSFALPPFYAEHGIVSTVDVLIKGTGGPWGVLEVDSPTKRIFDEHDIVFLTGFANVLAEASATAERTLNLRAAVEQMESLVAQKETLLLERGEGVRRLHDMQGEMLRITRLNGMGQMTAAIAHELNQPLAAISNFIGAARRVLIAESPDASLRAQELIDRAVSQTMRAGEIIRNLRNFVEKRDSVRTLEDIGEVVERSLALAHYNSLEEGVTVTLRLDEGLPPVKVDVIQVQQILINLIRNSIEAMRSRAKRELLIVTQRGEPGFATVTVQDTGPGLPPDVREKLFQPFVTTKDTGMGLGLTICEVLVKANGGQISLVTGLAEGTGFCFSLPLAHIAAGSGPLPDSVTSAIQ